VKIHNIWKRLWEETFKLGHSLAENLKSRSQYWEMTKQKYHTCCKERDVYEMSFKRFSKKSNIMKRRKEKFKT